MSWMLHISSEECETGLKVICKDSGKGISLLVFSLLINSHAEQNSPKNAAKAFNERLRLFSFCSSSSSSSSKYMISRVFINSDPNDRRPDVWK